MTDITGKNLEFCYRKNQIILEKVNIKIPSGKVIAILGRNGSGKSTLVRLLIGLLPLSEGEIYYNDKKITDGDGIAYVRKHCGIIFQNPDNQFVSPVLEDDIRFGLINHNIPESEQDKRIHNALDKVNLSGCEKRSLFELSGGQKQKAAIAGILAINNDVFIFDEATSMLDPEGCKEVLKCIRDLRSENHTIILVTQNIEDAIDADIVAVMFDRHIITIGKPGEILSNQDLLIQAGIKVPFAVRIYHDLKRDGIILPHCPLTCDELAEALCSLN